MIHHFQMNGQNFPLHDSRPGPRANRWKQVVLKIISPLLAAAKEMWMVKETSRRETLLGIPSAADRAKAARTKRHRSDIRSWFKRLDHRLGHLHHLTDTKHNIDLTPLEDLLRPSLPSTLAAQRLRRTTPPPLPPPSPIPSPRWKVTTI